MIPSLGLNPTPAQAASAISISEINWAGSSLSTADEWIELANLSDEPTSIAGWKITGAGSSGKTLVFPAGSMIPANGAYVVANYADTDAQSALAITPDAVTSTVSLSNAAMDIKLLDQNGELIDQAGDGHAPFAGYSSDIKASMIRMDFLLTGDSMEAWMTATSTQNLKNSDLGTPGVVDYALQEDPAAPMDLGAVPLNEGELISDQATSTNPLPEYTTSTTDIVVEQSTSTAPLLETATSTSDIPQNVMDVRDVMDARDASSGLLSNQKYLLLNEFMPDPAAGAEWIEITSSMPDRTIPLQGMSIHDSTGSILSLSGMLSATNTIAIFNLKSARLNNSGDTVSLVDVQGQTIDKYTYLESKEGVAWARDGQGAWRMTSTPTPGAMNQINEIVAPIQSPSTEKYPGENYYSSNTKQKATVKQLPNSNNQFPKNNQISKTQSSKTTSTSAIKPAATKTSATAKTKSTAKTTTTTAKPKTTTKTTSTKSNTIRYIDFDMIYDDSIGGIRVALEGTVGSPVRLLSSRAFVLLNSDGRGLLVRLGTTHKMPIFGTRIKIIGTLKFDTYDNVYLSVAKTDNWTALKTQENIHARSIPWVAPSVEDSWSLASVTGTVTSVSGSTISIVSDDSDLDVKIKPAVAYRASRLKAGDTIKVTGILDLSGERPALLPRSATEIDLIAHAPAAQAQGTATPQSKSGLPGWTPFAAAALAIGGIEGVKRVKNKISATKQKVVPQISEYEKTAL